MIYFDMFRSIVCLEKFWAFLKYAPRRPKVKPKLDEILKSYKCLEDFRIEGASFPQQFYQTKTGIKVIKLTKTSSANVCSFQTVPAPEAVAAAAAKEAAATGGNSDTTATGNSFKSSGEYFPSRNRNNQRQPNRRTTSERC